MFRKLSVLFAGVAAAALPGGCDSSLLCDNLEALSGVVPPEAYAVLQMICGAAAS
jgi:hypothetical protein